MDQERRGDSGRTWLVAAVVLLVAILVVFVVTSGGDEEVSEDANDGSAPVEEVGFDEQTGRCLGEAGPAFSRCRAELIQARSGLKNAATAEELYATSTGGDYTDQIGDLEAQGFNPPPAVIVSIMSAGDTYCLESTSDFLKGRLHYDSTVGAVKPGPCPTP